jgi:ERF superfamily protein
MENMNWQCQKIYEALVKAQAEFEPVVFDKVNPHFKSKYATLNAMQKATMPHLNKHGMSVLQILKSQPDGSNAGDMTVVTRLAHISGEFIESEFLVIRAGKNDQQLGSSITYARRFAYAAILCLSACEEEDDGNATQEIRPVSKSTSREQAKSQENSSEYLSEPQAKYITLMINGDEYLEEQILKEQKVDSITRISKVNATSVIDQLKRKAYAQ